MVKLFEVKMKLFVPNEWNIKDVTDYILETKSSNIIKVDSIKEINMSNVRNIK